MMPENRTNGARKTVSRLFRPHLLFLVMIPVTFSCRSSWGFLSLFFMFMLIIGLVVSRGRSPHPPSPPEIPRRKLSPDASMILELIHKRFQEPGFSLQAVSSQLDMGVRKITRILKEECHLTFTKLLNDLRIARGKELLINTRKSATEIAFEVGYNSYTHFTREFAKRSDVPPSKFRKENSLIIMK